MEGSTLSGISIRRGTEADEPLAIELLREGLGLERFDQAFWDWRYHLRPAGEGLFVVAVRDGVIVGTAGAIPQMVCCEGAEVVTWFTVDGFVHPSARGRGVFTKLARARLEFIESRGSPFTCAIASPMSYGCFVRRLGYRHVANVPYRVALTTAGALWLVRVIGRLWPRCPHKGVLGRFEVREAAGSAEIAEAAAVCERARPSRLTITRSPTMLEWRFAKHPWHHYDAFILYQGRQPLGYAILRGQNLLLIDFVEGFGVHQALLQVLLEYAAEHRISQLHCYCLADPVVERRLREMGFLHWPYEARPFGLYCQQPLVVRSLGAPAREPWYNRESWHLQMADIAYGF